MPRRLGTWMRRVSPGTPTECRENPLSGLRLASELPLWPLGPSVRPVAQSRETDPVGVPGVAAPGRLPSPSPWQQGARDPGSSRPPAPLPRFFWDLNHKDVLAFWGP